MAWTKTANIKGEQGGGQVLEVLKSFSRIPSLKSF